MNQQELSYLLATACMGLEHEINITVHQCMSRRVSFHQRNVLESDIVMFVRSTSDTTQVIVCMMNKSTNYFDSDTKTLSVPLSIRGASTSLPVSTPSGIRLLSTSSVHEYVHVSYAAVVADEPQMRPRHIQLIDCRAFWEFQDCVAHSVDCVDS